VNLSDLVVLDVNINGRMSYELAQLLVDRDVPIVFLTGYDSPAVEEKIAPISNLSKTLR
jgi:DNA-binding LytR/AlgR family response regulator